MKDTVVVRKIKGGILLEFSWKFITFCNAAEKKQIFLNSLVFSAACNFINGF